MKTTELAKMMGMPKRLAKAVKIVERLTDWIDANGTSCLPVAHVDWSPAAFSISIGDVCVYDTEGCSEDEFTFKACLAAYRKEIESLNEMFIAEQAADE